MAKKLKTTDLDKVTGGAKLEDFQDEKLFEPGAKPLDDVNGSNPTFKKPRPIKRITKEK